jgi:hypothetical protein
MKLIDEDHISITCKECGGRFCCSDGKGTILKSDIIEKVVSNLYSNCVSLPQDILDMIDEEL